MTFDDDENPGLDRIHSSSLDEEEFACRQMCLAWFVGVESDGNLDHLVANVSSFRNVRILCIAIFYAEHHHKTSSRLLSCISFLSRFSSVRTQQTRIVEWIRTAKETKQTKGCSVNLPRVDVLSRLSVTAWSDSGFLATS